MSRIDVMATAESSRVAVADRRSSLGVAERVRRVRLFFTYLTLCVGAVAFILPFMWMLSTSLKTSRDVLQFPPSFLPSEFEWNNYPDGWTAVSFTRYFLNSVLVTGLAMIGSLISSTLSAYAFARLKTRRSGRLFVLVLATMMIPAEITLVPQFVMFSELKMVN